jgi:hypothetical protein
VGSGAGLDCLLAQLEVEPRFLGRPVRNLGTGRAYKFDRRLGGSQYNPAMARSCTAPRDTTRRDPVLWHTQRLRAGRFRALHVCLTRAVIFGKVFRSCVHLTLVTPSEVQRLAQRAVTLLVCRGTDREGRRDRACAPHVVS